MMMVPRSQMSTLLKMAKKGQGKKRGKGTKAKGRGVRGRGILGDIGRFLKKNKVASRGLNALSSVVPGKFGVPLNIAGNAADALGFGGRKGKGKRRGKGRKGGQFFPPPMIRAGLR